MVSKIVMLIEECKKNNRRYLISGLFYWPFWDDPNKLQNIQLCELDNDELGRFLEFCKDRIKKEVEDICYHKIFRGGAE